MTENTGALQGDALVDALNAEIQESTTNDIIGTFVGKYVQLLTERMSAAQTSGGLPSITKQEITDLLSLSAREHGVEQGSALIQDLMNDPVVTAGLDSILNNVGSPEGTDETGLLTNFDEHLANTLNIPATDQMSPSVPDTSLDPSAPLPPDISLNIDPVQAKDAADAQGIQKLLNDTMLQLKAVGTVTRLGSTPDKLRKGIDKALSNASNYQFSKLHWAIQNPIAMPQARNEALDKILTDYASFDNLKKIATDKTLGFEYREAAFGKLQEKYGQIDPETGKLKIKDALSTADAVGITLSHTTSTLMAGSNIFNTIASAQIALQSSGTAQTKAILAAINGGAQTVASVVDPIADHIGGNTQLGSKLGTAGFTGAASIAGGIYSSVVGGQGAVSAEGLDKAKSALYTVGGGLQALKGIYNLTDTVATQIAKKTGSQGVKKVASFLSKSATKTALAAAGSTSKMTKAAAGFAIGVGSAFAIAGGITSLTLSAMKADEARRSGNAGQAAIYGIQAGLDAIGMILDVVSLVADFLPPIGTVVSAVLDIVNLALAGINTLLGLFAPMVDTRTDLQKTEQALDSLITSAPFQEHVTELANTFKDQGYDVFSYIVDAESTGTAVGDENAERTINRNLTELAQELAADNDARLAIIDASSAGHVLTGGNKDDYIDGGDGNDTIRGGKGNDILLGGRGGDAIYGGDGDDFIEGGPGADRLFGGRGDDTVVTAIGLDKESDGGPGDDTLEALDAIKGLYADPESLKNRFAISGFGFENTFPDAVGSKLFNRQFRSSHAELNAEEGKAYYHLSADFRALADSWEKLHSYEFGVSYFVNSDGSVNTNYPLKFAEALGTGKNLSDFTFIGNGMEAMADIEDLRILHTGFGTSNYKPNQWLPEPNTRDFHVTDGRHIYLARVDLSVGANRDAAGYNWRGNPDTAITWYKSKKLTVSQLASFYDEDALEPSSGSNIVFVTPEQFLGWVYHSSFVGTSISNYESFIADKLGKRVRITGSDRSERFQVAPDATVDAGGGDDTVYINTGLSGFKHSAVIDGGSGNDTVILTNELSNSHATTRLLESSDDPAEGRYRLINIENVVAGRGNDTIYGNSKSNALLGGAGYDTIYGGKGNDVLSGGDGVDILDGGEGIDTVNYSLDERDGDNKLKINLLTGETQYLNEIDGLWHKEDTLRNIENVYGSSNNDIIIGNGLNNTLSGGKGADRIEGGEGNDVLLGGAGNDVILGDSGSGNTDGNDYLSGGLGFDILDGEGGSDTASYSLDEDDAKRAHRIYLRDSGSTNTSTIHNGNWVAEDILRNIENLVGGNKNDILHGNRHANILNGAGGDDEINGRGGNDTLIFSAGNDRLDGGTGTDTLEYSTKGDAFFADLEAGHAENGAASSRHYQVNGYSLGNLAVGDTVTLELTLDDGRVLSISQTITNDNRAAWAWVSELHSKINSSRELSPYLQGTSEKSGYLEIASVFDSAGKNASLRLKLNGQDRSSALGLTTDTSRFGQAGEASLQGIENINASSATHFVHLRGDDRVNKLLAGSGHDWLSGGGGADTLLGNDGHDTLNGDGGADTLLGGEGNDTLNGGSEGDYLSGGAGDDALNGGSGNDVLVADGDTDILKGGADNDTYIITADSRESIIVDTEGRHTIEFKGVAPDELVSRLTSRDGRAYIDFYKRNDHKLASFDLGASSVLDSLVTAVRSGSQESLTQAIDSVFGNFASIAAGDVRLSGEWLNGFFDALVRHPGFSSEEAFGPRQSRPNSELQDLQGADNHWVYASGNEKLDDRGGDDLLSLVGFDHALFFRGKGDPDNLYIYDLADASSYMGDSDGLKIYDYFASGSDRGEGYIETISLNGHQLGFQEVERLVEATAQFMSDNGIASFGSSRASQYQSFMPSLAASSLT